MKISKKHLIIVLVVLAIGWLWRHSDLMSSEIVRIPRYETEAYNVETNKHDKVYISAEGGRYAIGTKIEQSLKKDGNLHARITYKFVYLGFKDDGYLPFRRF